MFGHHLSDRLGEALGKGGVFTGRLKPKALEGGGEFGMVVRHKTKHLAVLEQVTGTARNGPAPRAPQPTPRPPASKPANVRTY